MQGRIQTGAIGASAPVRIEKTRKMMTDVRPTYVKYPTFERECLQKCKFVLFGIWSTCCR